MPSRREIFTNGEFYHIFNKSLDRKKIFAATANTQRFFNLLRYYRSLKAHVRYSHYLQMPDIIKKQMDRQIAFEKFFKVEFLAYSLMPNHFHFLLKQLKSNGIVRTITDVINAFTRYFNLKEKRLGSIFLTQFKSKRIISREQLIHTNRYIHLNHYSSGLVKSPEDIINYPYSSLKEYLIPDSTNLCNIQIVLSEFNNNRERYKDFVLNHADYQKNLEYIKHAAKWL